MDAIRTVLLPCAFVVTPNVPEAEALTGLEIGTLHWAFEAARRIHAFGAAAVVIKGGHLPGDESIDVLFDGHAFSVLRAPREPSTNTHGTGCTFAAALAANLALGFSLDEAARRTKRYVTEAIRQGFAIGAGHGILRHDCLAGLQDPKPSSQD